MMSSAPRVRLADNGPEFSRIVLGLWRLAEWNMSPQQRLAFLEQALDAGITTIDQADIYGDYQSETLLGEALRLSPTLRSRFQFVSKCGIKLLSANRPAHRIQHYDTSRSHIIASAERSLQAMGIDTLDLLLIHRPDPLMDADEMAEAFFHLRQSGKVKYFGVSNFTVSQFELLASRIPLVTNQVELSLLRMDALQDGSLDLCQRLRILPMIWSALGGGALVSEGQTSNPAVLRLRPVLQELSHQLNLPVASIALSWVLQHPSRPLVLTGSGRAQAIREAVLACSHRLSREHWFALWCAATGHGVP